MGANQTCFVVVWEFRIKPGCEVAFERAYGPDGDWAQLFAKGEGHLSTELLADGKQADRYLVIDKWRSEMDYRRFKSQHGEAYLRLDRECLAMTQSENCLGMFASVI